MGKSVPGFRTPISYSTEIYTRRGACSAKSSDKIFNKCWIIACHESELPGAFDYRTFQPSGRHAADRRARRRRAGAQLLQHLPAPRQHAALRPGGQRASASPASSTRGRSTRKGNCIDISRGKQGYQERFCKADAGCARCSAEVGFGGFVWVNLDDEACTLNEYIGDALRHARRRTCRCRSRCSTTTRPSSTRTTSCGTTRTASSITTTCTTSIASPGCMQPGYFDRKYTGYPNGHASVGSMQIKYDAYEGSKAARRRLAGPRAGRLDTDRHLPRHDLQPAHLGAAHGHRRFRSAPTSC